jgi:hypothetical protein
MFDFVLRVSMKLYRIFCIFGFMKKLLLIYTILCSIQSFCQTPTEVPPVQYFGGIYEGIMYFNVVIFNKDTCYYTIEVASNGGEFDDVYCDSVRPMPCPIMHSFKLPTKEKELCIRVVAKIGNKVIDYQAIDFEAGKYTYIKEIAAVRSHPVHARF